jgi:hypothetical protein
MGKIWNSLSLGQFWFKFRIFDTISDDEKSSFLVSDRNELLKHCAIGVWDKNVVFVRNDSKCRGQCQGQCSEHFEKEVLEIVHFSFLLRNAIPGQKDRRFLSSWLRDFCADI